HKLGVSARLVNLILAERGWLKKNIRGWLLTPKGKQLGGRQHESEQSAIPYVTWPETILDNPRLLHAAAQLTAENIDATLPTLDGRIVHGNARRRIANWCYLTGVVCAQQYELNWNEERVAADFFLPGIQLCIDYWPAD